MNDVAGSIIFDIMREEYQRLGQVEEGYAATIAELPKGSARVKHIGAKDYLYLAYREGEKVVYEYVGPVAGEKAKKIIALVERRQSLAALLRRTRRDLKDVRRVLRGKI